MSLKRVRLELAREPGHPEGSADFGYEIVAPLKADGHLDVEEWRKDKSVCTVHRFWENEDDRHGLLTHTGKNWRFHYPSDGESADEDDPVYRLANHLFAVGEYISVDEDDGQRHTYRVVNVRPY